MQLVAIILCIPSGEECNRVKIQSRIKQPLCLSFFILPMIYSLLSSLQTPINGYLFLNKYGYLLTLRLLSLFKWNMLLSFIACTYLTTFPAPEWKEDQTSSIVNFLPECNPTSTPHRKPRTHMHKPTRLQGRMGMGGVIICGKGFSSKEDSSSWSTSGCEGILHIFPFYANR